MINPSWAPEIYVALPVFLGAFACEPMSTAFAGRMERTAAPGCTSTSATEPRKVMFSADRRTDTIRWGPYMNHRHWGALAASTLKPPYIGCLPFNRSFQVECEH